MISVALDLPDDPAEMPAWLERRLVGVELGALAAELEAVHGGAGTATLDSLLGDRRRAVLDEGLRALPPADVRALLTNPALLPQLQELVFAEGGPYWDRLGGAAAEHEALVDAGGRSLAAFLRGERPETPAVLPLGPRDSRAKLRWYARPAFVSLATAAALVLAAVGYDRLAPQAGLPPIVARAPTGWGWNKPDALAQAGTPSEYLNRLADEAQEWFKKRPEDSAAVAKRIEEFREGCSALIFSEHRPLAAKDRRWLVEKCRAWAAKLDDHVKALEAGRDPLQVRSDADQTVEKLVTALRTKAKEVAGG